MSVHITIPHVRAYISAAVVVALGGGMVLASLAASYDVLFRFGVGLLPFAILAVLIFFGVIVLWGPVVLLIAVLLVEIMAVRRPAAAYGQPAVKLPRRSTEHFASA